MPSIRGRLADQLVSAMGLKRKLTELAGMEPGSDEFAASLARLRRTDRRRPTPSVRASWVQERLDVSGYAMDLMTPKSGNGERVILYLHGGGYIFGPFPTEWSAMRKIGRDTGCDFAMLMYPRAPEHEAPRTVEVALAAFELLEARYGPGNVLLVGTSAGGGLALALTMERRDTGLRLPSALVLLSPGVDMTLQDDVAHLEEGDVLLSAEHVRTAGALYAGGLGADHPLVSPLCGDLSGLPPLHVFAATREILYPSLERFVEKARDSGTEAQLIVGEDQQHTWPLGVSPEAKQSRHQITALIGPAAE
jgi:monoterpene epsilon-lactone hydrolase